MSDNVLGSERAKYFSYPKNAKELSKKLNQIDEISSREYKLKKYEVEHPLFTHICVDDNILENSKILDSENLARFQATNFEEI